MNIKVFPIRSTLGHDGLINQESKKLLDELAKITGYSFEICEAKDLRTSDLGLILVQSGGSENEFKKIQPELKGPYYLLTYGSNNSLAASLEILSFIKRNGMEGEVIHGNSTYVAKRIEELVKKNKEYRESGERLGVIGQPSDWLISSHVDYAKAREIFGIELVDLTIAELLAIYRRLNVSLDPERFNAKYDEQELKKAYRLYKALKAMVKKYHLTGLTIRCFDILEPLKSTACLGLSVLNSKGVISACEGDVPALITMWVIRKVLGLSAFQANPCWIDAEENSIILAHCTLPLDMCESYEFNTHFESNLGVGIKGELKTSDVTILKVGADLNKYYCAEGKIVENLDRHDLCRTQIKVVLDSGVNYFLNSPLGNHHLIVYGHHKSELEKYLVERGLERVM
ncbi:MAG: hypothetical protein PHW22_03950 [Bacilli bacterium]|nr:hypothetical protein [Bacilli bacterium]